MDMQPNNPFGGQQLQQGFPQQVQQQQGFPQQGQMQQPFQQVQAQQPFQQEQVQQPFQQQAPVQQNMQPNNPFAGGMQQSFPQQPMQTGNPFASGMQQQDISASVEPVNPFSQMNNDVPDNSQYIAANNAAQFKGTTVKKKGKFLHFEYLPFGKKLGTFDMNDVATHKKLCVWMHFMPFLVFAPLLSEDCRKSGYVREVANNMFGLLCKYAILSAILGALYGPVALLSLLGFLRGLTGVLTTILTVVFSVLNLYYTILLICSLVCTAHGERYGHLFTSGYFTE